MTSRLQDRVFNAVDRVVSGQVAEVADEAQHREQERRQGEQLPEAGFRGQAQYAVSPGLGDSAAQRRHGVQPAMAHHGSEHDSPV